MKLGIVIVSLISKSSYISLKCKNVSGFRWHFFVEMTYIIEF